MAASSCDGDNQVSEIQQQQHQQHQQQQQRQQQREQEQTQPGTFINVHLHWQQRPFHDAVGKLYHSCYDHDSVVFASRVAASMTMASLFVLLFEPTDPYPNAIWVVITAGVVSWLPAPDIATALKKALERSIGTLLGAAIGLGIGFVSMTMVGGNNRAEENNGSHHAAQAAFLGAVTVAASFAVPYLANRKGYRASYAARLGCTTMVLVELSFYSVDRDGGEKVWEIGVYRTANIFIGALIGSLSALMFWPTSTRTHLNRKVQNQMRATGNSARTVLDKAHDILSGVVTAPPRLDDALRSREPILDEAILSYTKAMESLKDCRALFSLLKYDPYHCRLSVGKQRRFQEIMAGRVERTFRVQANIMALDMILQIAFHSEFNNSNHTALMPTAIPGTGDDDGVDRLKDIGKRVQLLMDQDNPNGTAEERRKAARDLMGSDMSWLRQNLDRVRNLNSDHVLTIPASPRSSSSSSSLSPTHECVAVMSLDHREQIELFFSMLEQLIVRVVRLYYRICDAQHCSSTASAEELRTE